MQAAFPYITLSITGPMFPEIFFFFYTWHGACLPAHRKTLLLLSVKQVVSPTSHTFVWDKQQSDWLPTSILQMGWEPPGHSPKVCTDSAHLCSSQKQQFWINAGYWAHSRPFFLRFTYQGQNHGVHAAPVAWTRYTEMLWDKNKGWLFPLSQWAGVCRKESLPVPLLLSQRCPE